MTSTIVTGAAGFIGFHLCKALLDRDEQVIGVDNLNDYYDPTLKQARVAQLAGASGFSFRQIDIADQDAFYALIAASPGVERVVNLAAQAGVRYSLENPHAYVQANIAGQLVVMDACRRLSKLSHFVYASSSSVYGRNDELPYSVSDRTDRPASVYAVSKRANELMAESYAHLYRMPITGLRFFTVYGPWGRPDMAAYIFARAIFEGSPIKVFNKGHMRRDFTYIDDIVAGVLAALDRPPGEDGEAVPHRIYNLGNNRSEDLLHFIEVLEAACGRAAIKELTEMQPGDVKATYADIDASRRDLGFEPRVSIEEGLPRFVDWYRGYHSC